LIIRFLFWLTGFWFLWKIRFCGKSGSNVKHAIIKNDTRNQINALKISIIIPARNEENTLPRLLNSLSRQTLKPHEVIVANDQSKDGTEQIALKYGARVINLEELPGGWLGKPWACYSGARNSTGDVFLFLDADTFLEEDGLEKILECYIFYKGVVSVQPYHKIKKLYENFSAYFNLILMGSMNTFTPMQLKLKPIGAFGPCLLCGRDSYFKIDGHGSAKGEILEDLEIGKKFLKNGIPVYCFGGKGTINFRMYPHGLKSLINGFARGFTIGARSTSILNLFLVIFWIAGAFYPVTLIIQNSMNLNIVELTAGIVFYIAYSIQILWMIKRIGNFNPAVAIFFPVYMIFFILVFFWSVIINIFRINIKWKGRSINNRKIK